ncbi:hypothetical protein BN874_2320002 [Candidatus Contendobacter odensis Run_B_J11]|uniref:Uncharacterized protein n=1 Tax=Candidatus Contendobacter odensis Run_B_J11 TaxID=1400861 RepID=A0A7U7GBQ3_9GAMM|nr:hypothetical protein BN874_2320002 [Candidatus Contendobacter odensis Run_B_J11]
MTVTAGLGTIRLNGSAYWVLQHPQDRAAPDLVILVVSPSSPYLTAPRPPYTDFYRVHRP